MAATARARRDEQSARVTEPTSALILGYALWRSGSTAEGFSLLIAAAELVEHTNVGEPEYEVFAAFMLVLVTEHGRAASILNRLIRDARATGALGVLPFALGISAYLDIRRGRWAAGYATASEAVEIASETGGALWRCIGLSALASVEAGQGREQACREHAHEAHTLAVQLDIEPLRDVFDALGLLELGLGRFAPAVEAFERASSVPRQPQSMQLRPSTPDLVDALIRIGDPRARDVARTATEHAEATGLPGISAIAARCRGLVAAVRGGSEAHRGCADVHDRSELHATAKQVHRAGTRRDRVRRVGVAPSSAPDPSVRASASLG